MPPKPVVALRVTQPHFAGPRGPHRGAWQRHGSLEWRGRGAETLRGPSGAPCFGFCFFLLVLFFVVFWQGLPFNLEPTKTECPFVPCPLGIQVIVKLYFGVLYSQGQIIGMGLSLRTQRSLNGVVGLSTLALLGAGLYKHQPHNSTNSIRCSQMHSLCCRSSCQNKLEGCSPVNT